MTKETISLKTTIYTQFYDFDYSQQLLRKLTFPKAENRSDDVNKACKLLVDKKMNFALLNSGEQFELIKLSGYDQLKNDDMSDKDKLVFNIDQRNDQYTISTGIFCGVINFGDKLPSVEITAGISDSFFKRILNHCCGIYADTNTKSSTSKTESIYSLLIQYLFLISLRKVASQSFPKRYLSRTEREYSIKGEIDIEEYVNKDILMFDKKVTYKNQTMKDIQNIIDVLYEACKKCEITKSLELPDIARLKIYLKDNYSHKKCSKGLIKNILKDKSLFNSLYSDFKMPLRYAQVLLNNEDLNYGENSKISGISGYLIDASFLWEMYLYNLLRMNLPDWKVDSQTVISFYDNTFYKKNNRPDLVLTNKKDGRVFVFDAKFKSMRFSKYANDVDNNDIRQLHAYSYYYSLTEKDKFCGAALIYPTQVPYEDQTNNVDQMYSIKDAPSKFGVFAVYDPGDKGNIKESEEEFIRCIKVFIRGEDA